MIEYKYTGITVIKDKTMRIRIYLLERPFIFIAVQDILKL
ncbi:MAG: hypothetical protein Fur0020_15370 [Thermodesulfovibrionia bacterium]